jgi:hypothetical protein
MITTTIEVAPNCKTYKTTTFARFDDKYSTLASNLYTLKQWLRSTRPTRTGGLGDEQMCVVEKFELIRFREIGHFEVRPEGLNVLTTHTFHLSLGLRLLTNTYKLSSDHERPKHTPTHSTYADPGEQMLAYHNIPSTL